MGNQGHVLHAAQKLMCQNKLEQADQLYCSVLKKCPKNLCAQLQRGRILRRQAKPKEALMYFEKALENHPDDSAALLEFANELNNQKYYKLANEYYLRIPQTASNYYETLIGLGICASRQGLHKLALNYFEEATGLDPQKINAVLWVASELSALDRVTEADALYQVLLEQYPEHSRVLQGLALSAYKKGDRERALTLYKQLAVIQPDNLEAQTSIAIGLRKLERFDEADSIYNKMLIQDPKYYPAMHGIAINARERGDRKVALIHFEALYELFPGRSQSTIDLIIELRLLGRLDEALIYLQVAEQKHPENAFILIQKAHIYQQQDDYEKALSYFQKALSLQPLNLKIKLYIADGHFMLGAVNSAIECIQQVLQHEPLNFNALLQLGKWCVTAQVFEGAQYYYQQLLVLYPQKVQPYLLSAQAFLEMGEEAKCFAILDKATVVLGEKVEVYHKKIQVLWDTRQIQSALVLQERAVQQFPSDFSLCVQQIKFQISRGQYKKAKSNISLLLPTNINQQLVVKLLLVQIIKEQWRLEDALLQYQAILKDHPGCIEAQHAIFLILLVGMDLARARKQIFLLGRLSLGRQKINGQNRYHLHNYHAQFMDECEINHPVLRRVQAAIDFSDIPQRLQMIVDIVLEEPEASSAAIVLLAQLRLAGKFLTIRSNHKHKQVIPKKIFQYWDKHNPPEDVLKLTKSWQQQNPRYEYQLLDRYKASYFLQQNYPEKVFRNFQRCKHAAQQADILRLALLLQYGGIYADADDCCLQPLDELLRSGGKLILCQEEMATVGNNFIAVTANHPVINIALENAISAIERGDKESIWLSTGPGLVSRSLAYYLAQCWPKQTPQDLGVIILTQTEMMSYDAFDGKLAYKSTKDSWLVKEFSQGNKVNLLGLLPDSMKTTV